jgi:hypothetical protein
MVSLERTQWDRTRNHVEIKCKHKFGEYCKNVSDFSQILDEPVYRSDELVQRY